MSEVKVNKISPRSGTAFTLGDSGDTFTVPSGATLTTTNATVNLPASVGGLGTGITNSQLAGSIDVTSKITGVIPTANLGSGSASGTTFLRGDQTYATPAGGAAFVLSVKNNGSQTLSDAVLTKLDVGTSLVDTEGEFNTGTSTWTPAVGEYLMFVNIIGYPAGASARGFSCEIWKDGSNSQSYNMYSNNSAQYFGNSDDNGGTYVKYISQTDATDHYEWYLYAQTESVNWNASAITVNVFKV